VREGRVAVLGVEHPHTLKSLNSLAYAYQATGRVNDAVTLFEQVRVIRERDLGLEHPSTQSTLNGLAQAYLSVGKIAEGVKLFELVRGLQEKHLGLENPATLSTQSGLAGAYRLAGRLQDSIRLYEQVAATRERVLGTDNTSTLTTRHNLAFAYQAAGRLDEAIALFEKVGAARSAKLGAGHSETLITLNNLANAYVQTGQVQKAVPIFERIAGVVEREGYHHANAIGIIANTVIAYEKAQQFDRAEGWLRKWAAVIKERSGSDSLAYATELEKLGVNLARQKKWGEAETPLRECFRIRRSQDAEAWTTFHTQSLLGGALLGQKKYAEVEPLLVAGYDGMKIRVKSIPLKNTSLLEALDRLIELYTATKRPEEVTKYQSEKNKLLAEQVKKQEAAKKDLSGAKTPEAKEPKKGESK
jgi:tetratricopeptide (TPR) repeat protein